MKLCLHKSDLRDSTMKATDCNHWLMLTGLKHSIYYRILSKNSHVNVISFGQAQIDHNKLSQL